MAQRWCSIRFGPAAARLVAALRMRAGPWLLLLLGACALVAVVGSSDTTAVVQAIAASGWELAIAVMTLYVVYFAADALNWHASLPSVATSARWFVRLYLVRMVGDAYNSITPTASLGGDAVKAWLLKRRYGIGYRESGASLVIARTCSMIALALFAAVGTALLVARPGLGADARALVISGFATLTLGTVACMLVQYFGVTSRLVRLLAAHPRAAASLARVAGAIVTVERQLVGFYRGHRRRLIVAVVAAFLTWILGAVEAYLVLHTLGLPVGLAEVWMLEAGVQLVRVAAFLIPAGLGAQEGAMVIAVCWLSGTPTLGVAAALIRRGRELAWIALSLLIGVALGSAQPRMPTAPVERG